jgi:hypothetical protein
VTQRHKDFSAGPRNNDPITFTLEGESFAAKSNIPGAKLLDFVVEADSTDGGKAAAALVDFIKTSLVKEDVDRFTTLIEDDDKSIQIETLGAICEWLVEQYTARPTQLPSTSLDGQTTNGPGSTAPVSSMA